MLCMSATHGNELEDRATYVRLPAGCRPRSDHSTLIDGTCCHAVVLEITTVDAQVIRGVCNTSLFHET